MKLFSVVYCIDWLGISVYQVKNYFVDAGMNSSSITVAGVVY